MVTWFLAIPGNKFDATDVAILATTSVDDLANLRHVERPKEWNIPALKAVFELLGLTPGMAQLVAQGKDEPVHELQKAVENRVKKLVMAQQALQAGFRFWGRSLLDESAAKGLRSKLDGAKRFLESLQTFSSPGKLKNFRQSKGDVEQQKAGLDALQEVETLQDLVADLGATASYLSTAEAVLPLNHEWVDGMKEATGRDPHASLRSGEAVGGRLPAAGGEETRRAEEGVQPCLPRSPHPRAARGQRRQEEEPAHPE